MIKFHVIKSAALRALTRTQKLLWNALTFTLGPLRSGLCFVFGIQTPESILRELRRTTKEINALEPEMSTMTQEDMLRTTEEMRTQLANKQTTLDAVLPRAFAMVREASKRVLGMRPYDVQLMGGIAMHRGMIAEMCTGEGKTLVAALPSYLNALTGKGVYVVTVNDYLAQRDSALIGQIHQYLGLKVACVTHNTNHYQKQDAYRADIVYITNSEMAFDYLRDNMCATKEHLVQRTNQHFAIVDEIDSILIDEARTPLIISGPSDNSVELYQWADAIVSKLNSEDYNVEEKRKIATFTKSGIHRIERNLRKQMVIDQDGTLFDPRYTTIVHTLQQSLRAHVLYKKDVDYIVHKDAILLVDEFTGRILSGRRYSDGLHQAIEAKERVEIKGENVTVASITYQNYFRMFDKLAGMTGTASTEAGEFKKIYNLDVLAIPTHVPVIREDRDDYLFRTNEEKVEAVTNLVEDLHNAGQPVLVGTSSIEKSEEFSKAFVERGIPHNTLNARYHQQEADIIAEAGTVGAVTIATNMAGRGTDIKLGGSSEEEREKVVALGGLFVVGTERHESRRIDNQLRGRSGRQGDPGVSQFFVCLEDRLMRTIQDGGRLERSMASTPRGEPLCHYIVNYSINSIQQKVEAYHSETRKHVLKYDEAMNEQRKVVYRMRRDVLLADGPQVALTAFHIMTETLDNLLSSDDLGAIKTAVQNTFDTDVSELTNTTDINMHVLSAKIINTQYNDDPATHDQFLEHVFETLYANKLYNEVREGIPAYQCIKALDKARAIQTVYLQTIDRKWTDHLSNLDYTKQQCQLQGYAQRDPLNAYKNAALITFENLLTSFKEEMTAIIARITETEGEEFSDISETESEVLGEVLEDQDT